MPDITTAGDGQTTVGDGIPGTEDGTPAGVGTVDTAHLGDGADQTTDGIIGDGITATDGTTGVATTTTAGLVTETGTEDRNSRRLLAEFIEVHQDIKKLLTARVKGLVATAPAV